MHRVFVLVKHKLSNSLSLLLTGLSALVPCTIFHTCVYQSYIIFPWLRRPLDLLDPHTWPINFGAVHSSYNRLSSLFSVPWLRRPLDLLDPHTWPINFGVVHSSYNRLFIVTFCPVAAQAPGPAGPPHLAYQLWCRAFA